jgi:protein-disulfide isomerase
MTKSNAGPNNGLVLIGTVVAAVIVFAVVMLIITSQLSPSSPTKSNGESAYATLKQGLTVDGSPTLGEPTAPVILEEFADFSCSHCLEYHPVIKQYIDKYVRTGKVQLIFRPLTFVGQQYSINATNAALCAARQNKFWEMHDALFDSVERQGINAYKPDALVATGVKLGLDVTAVKLCIAENQFKTQIAAIADIGKQRGVDGTPSLRYSVDGGKTFQPFVMMQNGKQQPIMSGAIPPDVVDALVRSTTAQ